MTNEIQIFNNPNFGEVRVQMDASGEPWFCAADITNALGYNNGRDAVSKHVDERDVAKRDVSTPIISQGVNTGKAKTMQMTYVSESGVYALIFGSKLPQAKEFKHWVTSEVLPSIRKTGGYNLPRNYKDALQQLIEKEEEKERLMLENQQQAALIEKSKPKTVFADAIIGSQSSCLIGELAKILTQNGYVIGQNRLFKQLREDGYLGKVGENYNIPLQRYVEQGLFEIKKSVHSENGVMKTVSTPKVTGRGQQYFINKFLCVASA